MGSFQDNRSSLTEFSRISLTAEIDAKEIDDQKLSEKHVAD